MAALFHLCCLSWVLVRKFTLASEISPIDLSHYYDRYVITWPEYRPFEFTREVRSAAGQPWYAGNEFEMAEHSGTHLDAPFHFNKDGWHIGQIPFERLFPNGVVIDFTKQSEANPDYLVTADDLQDWEKTYGPIPNGSVVLLYYGWTGKYCNKSAYLGTENVTDLSTFHYPGLSEEGAKWLAETGRVYGVGTDTASIDYGQSKDFPSHRVITSYNMYIIEHIALPDPPLPATGFQLMILPMKIRYGTGAPCRVVAMLSDKNTNC